MTGPQLAGLSRRVAETVRFGAIAVAGTAERVASCGPNGIADVATLAAMGFDVSGIEP